MSSINLKSILVNKKKKGFSRESKKVQIGLKTYSEGRSRGKLLWDVPWEFGKSKKDSKAPLFVTILTPKSKMGH